MCWLVVEAMTKGIVTVYYMKTGRGRVEEVLWLKEWSQLPAGGGVHTLYSVNQIFTTLNYWCNFIAEFVPSSC